ncbi:MAG: hypothetical protein U5J97_03430 [Trueperaceae bacterium]|nr:hypothetical protein [Trueperaceae bacterium]
MDFASDPRVLRGTWTGTVEGYEGAGESSPLRLELGATYVGTSSYTFSGAFHLAGEPPRTIEGTVYGNSGHTYVAPQTPAYILPSAEAEIRENGEVVWEFRGSLDIDEPVMLGDLIDPDDPAGDPDAFSLQRASHEAR